jgi:N-acetyl-gamma-glutamyl-phosphate reductase
MSKLKVAIVGASGYMGEELLRLLLRHSQVEITAITSRQYAGQGVEEVFPRFAGSGLRFSNPSVPELSKLAEVVFLSLPHGLAAEYAKPLLANGLRVLDLSADFRLHDTAYKDAHPAPELLPQAVYGSPERHYEQIRQARLVACPGCYPTSIVLPVSPLLRAGLVKAEGIIVASASGVSGAGRKVELGYLFPECNESLRPYAVTGHRHIPEIEQELGEANGGQPPVISFVPHLVPLNRGIHSTIFLQAAQAGLTVAAVHACLVQAYATAPCVRVLPLGKLADTKNVAYTNVCEIAGVYDARTQRVILSSAIDNLTKGGSGQAVQCFNIMCGFPETSGLV